MQDRPGHRTRLRAGDLLFFRPCWTKGRSTLHVERDGTRLTWARGERQDERSLPFLGTLVEFRAAAAWLAVCHENKGVEDVRDHDNSGHYIFRVV